MEHNREVEYEILFSHCLPRLLIPFILYGHGVLDSEEQLLGESVENDLILFEHNQHTKSVKNHYI